MSNVICTTAELGEKLKVDYQTAQGLLKFLSMTGKAVEHSKLKIKGKKGKPTTIWSITLPCVIFEDIGCPTGYVPIIIERLNNV